MPYDCVITGVALSCRHHTREHLALDSAACILGQAFSAVKEVSRDVGVSISLERKIFS